MSTFPDAFPILSDCEQGTPDWIALRVGKVTASRISDMLAEIKKGEAASRRNYRAEIVCETLTGVAIEQYVSKEMQWGLDQERFARAAYELQQDVMITTIGFATHARIERFGASPDGLVGEDGGVEIKCPNTATHIEYLLGGVVPEEHKPQMLANMACTGRTWWDFVSFDPRLPEHLQLFIRRLNRDDLKIADIETKAVKFLEEVDEIIARLHFAGVDQAPPAKPEPIPPAAAPEPQTEPEPPTPRPSRPRAAKSMAQIPTLGAAKPRVTDYSNFDDYDTDKCIWLIQESLRQYEEKKDKLLKAATAPEIEEGAKKKRLLN